MSSSASVRAVVANPTTEEVLREVRSLRASIEARVELLDRLGRQLELRLRVERLVELTRHHAHGVAGLREAYVSPEADEVIFVGDDWDSLTDRVSELLDGLGAALDPGGETFVRGGLRPSGQGLEGHVRVALG